jgi:hypothetical protein
MDDPARDAYYGGTLDLDEGMAAPCRTPTSKNRSSRQARAQGQRPRSSTRVAMNASRKTYPPGDGLVP